MTARSRLLLIVAGLAFGWFLMSAAVYVGKANAEAVHVTALVDTAPAITSTPADPLTELQALKLAYEALKANQDPSLKMLLWAGVLAAGLKLALTAFNRLVYKETKSWTRWVAVSAAVPIALLSHYALGNGWFASLVYAGSGPGAIVAHELWTALTKKKVAQS